MNKAKLSQALLVLAACFAAGCSPSQVAVDNTEQSGHKNGPAQTKDTQREASENDATFAENNAMKSQDKPIATMTKPSSDELAVKLAKSNDKSKPIAQEPSLLNGELLVKPQRLADGAIEVMLTVNNPQSHGVYLEFRSGMGADLMLLSGAKTVWKWSNDMMFTQAINYKTIAAGGSLKYRFVIPAKVVKSLREKQYDLRADFKGVATESNQLTINSVFSKLNLSQ